MNHWLIDTIREVHAGHARPVCLWAILCAVIGHDDDPDAIVPGLGQCRRCHLNAPYGSAPERVDPVTLGAASTGQFWAKTDGAPDWLADGARCLDADPDLFHPLGHSEEEQAQVLQTLDRYCVPCPMTDACYAWGRKEGKNQGIWGAAWLDGPKDMHERRVS